MLASYHLSASQHSRNSGQKDWTYFNKDLIQLQKSNILSRTTPSSISKRELSCLLHFVPRRRIRFDPSLRPEEVRIFTKDVDATERAPYVLSDARTARDKVSIDSVSSGGYFFGAKTSERRAHPETFIDDSLALVSK